MLPTLQFKSLLPPLAAHLGVVGVVALLAQRREVQKVRRFWPVVKHMRRRQNHFAARYRVRLSVLGSAPLASVPRPEKTHKSTTQLPVFRVSGFVLRSYRHLSSNPALNAAPFSRWTPGDKAARRPLALRYALPKHSTVWQFPWHRRVSARRLQSHRLRTVERHG